MTKMYECPSCGKRESPTSRTTREGSQRLCINPKCKRKPPMRPIEVERTTVALRFPAPPHRLFTPEAAESMVGQSFPMTVLGKTEGRALVVGTELEPGGSAIVAVLEVDVLPDGYALTKAIRLHDPAGAFSIEPEVIL